MTGLEKLVAHLSISLIYMFLMQGANTQFPTPTITWGGAGGEDCSHCLYYWLTQGQCLCLAKQTGNSYLYQWW